MIENGERTSRFLQKLSKLYCWLDYYCRFGPPPTTWEVFFIIYNILVGVVLTPFVCFLALTDKCCHHTTEHGIFFIIAYLLLGFLFSTIMCIAFSMNNLSNHHQFRSLAGSSFVKQIDEKRRTAGCLISIMDILVFFLLLVVPFCLNIFYIVLLTR